MVVGIGQSKAGKVLLIAIDAEEVVELQTGRTVNYERGNIPAVSDIMIIYGRTRADVIHQLEAAGVSVQSDIRDAYLRGERTDNPR